MLLSFFFGKKYHLKLFLFFYLLTITAFSNAQLKDKYPVDVLSVLKKSDKNRSSLEDAINYFEKLGDPLKLRAIYFLISNMDIHYSNDYYWADSTGKRIDYREVDYPSLETALNAFEAIKGKVGKVTPVPYTYTDIETISSGFLIGNVEGAFRKWKTGPYKNISFEQFCEDILPYRVSTEPLQQWREVYQKKFEWLADSAKNKNTEALLNDLAIDFKSWFINTWDLEKRSDPLPRLGPLQLLSRKKGNCDDIGDLEVYLLRSQGYPGRLEHVPFWATTTGRHYFNSTLDENGKELPFDISTPKVKINGFSREPSKVIRVTYSKQPKTLASSVSVNEIPVGFLRMVNYIDVTSKYWQTGNLNLPLFKTTAQKKIVYACVFNGFKWQPTWWANVKSGSAVFEEMCRGAVFLPMFYDKGKLIPAGNPTAFGYKHQQLLQADTINKQSITLKQQDKYLIFQPDKKYKLYYWRMGWKFLEGQQAKEGAAELIFSAVPKNALFLLVPEYSQGKERPFIIDDEGARVWF
ncbi:hypothetical protein QFZ20_002133 [Flavobacterium sp. W4I14]|nr:hypothetical protein [Flavobacterium sp. W4I14]